ncbi:hypothetical protein [Nonlabens tegetincola]|uniref:hypothetical protein n=1 Tax=Nonlabens tegetincola TaxID=323273 RepID=UPI000CF499AF|nr:hypothetical protein [Nonlabens tegetincola]
MKIKIQFNMKYYLYSLIGLMMMTSCKKEKQEVLDVFDNINKETEFENSKYDRDFLVMFKDSAIAHPETYAVAQINAEEFHYKTTQLVEQLEHVKNEIDNFIGEVDNYEMMDKLVNPVFFSNDSLNSTGIYLKQIISDYYTSVEDQVYFFADIEKKVQSSFNLEPVIDVEGEKKGWVDYHYKDFPSIAAKVKISQLQETALQIEREYYEALMKKPKF